MEAATVGSGLSLYCARLNSRASAQARPLHCGGNRNNARTITALMLRYIGSY